eukprot:200025-Amphidinium_carterae.1
MKLLSARVGIASCNTMPPPEGPPWTRLFWFRGAAHVKPNLRQDPLTSRFGLVQCHLGRQL